jgi:voltage-gated potassium channel
LLQDRADKEKPLEPSKNRRLITLALLRSLATTTVIVALYYVLPLDHAKILSTWIPLIVGLAVLMGVTAWEVRAIINARYPVVRAIEALAITAPAFLLLFAANYYIMAQRDPATFTEHLTRTDALYFTVTTFSTVGYGDIAPVSEYSRLVATVQMILDLLILGLGIRVLIDAVQVARQRPSPGSPS